MSEVEAKLNLKNTTLNTYITTEVRLTYSVHVKGSRLEEITAVFAHEILALTLRGVWSLRNLVISVPRAVLSGEGQSAVLRCSYDLEGAALYSIRWYRAETEFYRYVPRELPPTMVFPLPGASVDLSVLESERYQLGRSYTHDHSEMIYQQNYIISKEHSRQDVSYMMTPPESGHFTLGCIATIHDIYARRSEVLVIREDAPRPASVTGEESAGIVCSI
ncbi:unnamed protein product, partial [Leptidea sinapis]